MVEEGIANIKSPMILFTNRPKSLETIVFTMRPFTSASQILSMVLRTRRTLRMMRMPASAHAALGTTT